MNNKKMYIPDPDEMEQLQKDLELAMENDDGKLKILPSRASIKRQFAHFDKDSAMQAQAALEKLDEQLGNTDTTNLSLTYPEVDSFVEELLAVRRANDILSAREQTLKTYANNVISNTQLEPDKTPGELISPKHKVKITKEIRGGKLSIDIDLLKKRLTGEQFDSVTNKVVTIVETTTPDGKMDEVITTSYTVNEKCLEAELLKGNILSEDIFLSSVESKRTTAIYVRDIEN